MNKKFLFFRFHLNKIKRVRVCVRVYEFLFLVMRFYCHCLNVNIDVLKTNDDQETLTRINNLILFFENFIIFL